MHKERVTRVRVCNYVKIAAGRNFPPALKIVTRTAQAAENINVAFALTLSRSFLCTLALTHSPNPNHFILKLYTVYRYAAYLSIVYFVYRHFLTLLIVCKVVFLPWLSDPPLTLIVILTPNHNPNPNPNP